MKLLFDHNLSLRLVSRLSDLFPDSSHVYWLGLDQVDDRTVREYALQQDFIIVTKNADYSELCWWWGFPHYVFLIPNTHNNYCSRRSQPKRVGQMVKLVVQIPQEKSLTKRVRTASEN